MVLAYATAIIWGGLVLAGGWRVAARAASADRVHALRDQHAAGTRWPDVAAIDGALERVGVVGRVVLGTRRRRAAARRDRRLARELPAAVDLLAVAMSAGATPFGAVEAVARWSPPAVAETFG